MRRSTEGPSTIVSPSSSIPSSKKNALAASRSSTTTRTLSIRSNLFFVIVIKLLYLPKSSQAVRCVRRQLIQLLRRLHLDVTVLMWSRLCLYPRQLQPTHSQIDAHAYRICG